MAISLSSKLASAEQLLTSAGVIENITALGNKSGVVTIPFDGTGVYTLTATGNITFAFSNPPTSAFLKTITIITKQDPTGNRVFTWPVSKKTPGGIALPQTLDADAEDHWTVTVFDGGISYTINLAQKDVK